ncbi:MAG: LPS assembly lipoprotein LptE [Syntrophorhabdales bacterium]|jgi:hypothetical protein
MKRPTSLFALLICLALVGGCGYELVRDKGIYSGDITSLSVPVFKSTTFEPQVPGIFTEAFSMELASAGLFELNKPDSDAILQGTVNMVTTGAGGLSSTTGQTIQKTVTVLCGLTLTKQGKRVKTWTFSDSEVYDASSINLEDFNKRLAMQRVASRMARRFHAQLLTVR